MPITPDEQKILDQAKLIADANPEDNGWKTDADILEKRFKDTQASFTKAQQSQIEMAKMLVEQDPNNVDKIPDEKVRTKVLQEKWWVESLDELRIMFPDYWKPLDDGEDDKTELEKLQATVRLMQHNGTKTQINSEIESAESKFKDVIATIPEFRTKLNEELKSISETLSPKDRVDKALKLVLNSSTNSANAYAIMQGLTGFKAGGNEEKESKKVDASLVKEIMSRNRI